MDNGKHISVIPVSLSNFNERILRVLNISSAQIILQILNFLNSLSSTNVNEEYLHNGMGGGGNKTLGFF